MGGFSSTLNLFSTQTHKIAVIDLVDPDNFVLAYLLARDCQQKNEVLHIVCVGRPVNFALPRWHPNGTYFDVNTNEVSSVQFSSNFIKEDPPLQRTYKYIKEHGDALLKVNAFNLASTLMRCGIANKHFILYDGGIAPNAGLSYRIHEFEEGFIDKEGKTVTYEIYLKYLTDMVNLPMATMNLQRLQRCEQIWSHAAENLTKIDASGNYSGSNVLPSLDSLISNLSGNGLLRFFVGGPMTPFLKLLEKDAKIGNRSGEIRFMGPVLDGSQNLLGENFNVAADPEAYEKVTNGQHFRNMKFVFYPTETCKHKEILEIKPEDLIEQMIPPNLRYDGMNVKALTDKMDLWARCKQNKNQPLFDTLLYYDNPPFVQVPVSLSIVDEPKSPSGKKHICTPIHNEKSLIKQHKSHFAFIPQFKLI